MSYALATERPPRTVPLGLVGFLATTVMLFTTFAASYLVRRTAPDWHPVSLPALAWFNLVFLAGASAALEKANRSGAREGPRTWLAAAALLGFAFLAAQILVWSQLRSVGVFVRGNPHAAFFYLLTLVHGVHMVGGLGALGYAAVRPHTLRGCTVFWHTIGVIWLVLLVFISVM